jgi:phenylpyruvate tautomerase PptA (4-oxalocrotonate tautomerase family)
MRFRVIVPEGVVSEALRPELAAGLVRSYAALFRTPAAELGVDFTELPRGRFFSAGELSRTSIIAGTVPAGTKDDQRHRLLAEITALWCETTGCSPHEVVVTAADARPA